MQISTAHMRYIAQQLMKTLFSILVSKLSAKRFAGLHSDWSKLLLGSHALVRGHRYLKCVLPILQRYANKMRGIVWKFYCSISQN